jgi:hypothetical protein
MRWCEASRSYFKCNAAACARFSTFLEIVLPFLGKGERHSSRSPESTNNDAPRRYVLTYPGVRLRRGRATLAELIDLGRHSQKSSSIVLGYFEPANAGAKAMRKLGL